MTPAQRLLPCLARALRTAALALLPLLALAPTAQAAVVFAPFSGSGNVSVFDPASGSGGWAGSIVQAPEPGLSNPLDLVSLVFFTIDPLTQLLRGNFSFTRSSDLGATLFGLVSGSTADADVLRNGGQFALDYSIQGGTGDLAGASGFGLSFLQFDPNGTPDNYQESGLLLFAVPEPGSLPLLAVALGGLAWLRRRHPARR